VSNGGFGGKNGEFCIFMVDWSTMDKITAFRAFIWDFYQHNRRDFAWRNIDNPYYVLVSEIMLQQTQTHRVIGKYEEFIAAFPNIQSLAASQLRDVINVWQGLGYYRRARFLHQLARIVVDEHGGILPQDAKALQTLPGIGAGTAGSLGAFAYNRPTVFIETNIRAVFIHCFFSDKQHVSDKELLPLIAATVDHDNPREWYYALMDYGVWCKAHYSNPSRKSAHYNKQSKFEGSDRQIRAHILKLVAEKEMVNHQAILNLINKETARVETIINKLVSERFIKKNINDVYSVA
jgi:A/G-specific adenine glycosylase